MTTRLAHQALLQAISRVQLLPIGSDDSLLFDEILAHILQLTDSEYGFVAEIVRNAGDTPFVRTRAITHNDWSQDRTTPYEVAGGDGHHRSLATLFSTIAGSGKPLIARSVAPAQSTSLPPPTTVLGLPLQRGDRSLGLIGIGNRSGGYDAALVSDLQPFLHTCATLMDGHRNERTRRETEAHLRRSEEQFRSVTENALDLVSILRRDGTVEYASPSHERILGYAAAELVGKNLFSFIAPEDLPRGLTEDAVDPERSDGPVVQFRFRHRDGSWRVLEGIGKSIVDGASAAAIVVNARDVTEHRKAAAELRNALSLLSATIESTADALLVVDRQNRIVSFNRKFLEMWRIPDSAIAVGDDAEALSFTLNRLKDPARFRQWQLELQTQPDAEGCDLVEFCDGQIFERYSQPQRVAGVSVGRVWSFRDVTERKRAEETRKLETQIAAALARVGREMITSLDTPVLLDRVCQLTVDTLGCEFSRTLLYRPGEAAYLPVAGHGHTPEQWEALRVVQLPTRVMLPLLARLEREDVVTVDAAAPEELQPLARAMADGAISTLYVALRRGGELTGVLSAGYRVVPQAFTPAQRRIAAAIAQLASFALENARLFEELENATRLRADFVATMSHELRTPLHIIMGYADLLLEGEFGALLPEQANRLQRLAKNAHALLDLINATLDVSRLEGGRVPLKVRDIHLPDFIAELDTDLREWLDKPKVRLTCTTAAGLPTLRSDPTKLKVVLKNLVGNALKFTEQGSVDLDVRSADGGIVFTVTDTGIGIAPDARSFIFEPFRQAEAAMTRSFGGAGLGLYIVRRLLDMLAGSIELESEVGRGSVFRVWIPLRHDLDDAPASAR